MYKNCSLEESNKGVRPEDSVYCDRNDLKNDIYRKIFTNVVVKLTCIKCEQSLIPPGTDIEFKFPDLNIKIIRDTDYAPNAQAMSKILCPNCNSLNYILWDARVVDEQGATNFRNT